MRCQRRAQAVKQIENFHPGDPDLTLDLKIDKLILALYQAFRAPLRFQPSDVISSVRATKESSLNLSRVADPVASQPPNCFICV